MNVCGVQFILIIQFRHITPSDEMDLIAKALENEMYGSLYGRRKHEYPVSSTPANFQDNNDDRKADPLEQQLLGNPERQKTQTVHPSRYNALPIGKKYSGISLKPCII